MLPGMAEALDVTVEDLLIVGNEAAQEKSGQD
jgi:hypothetical protein